MNNRQELEKVGCKVFTRGETGLKISVRNGEVVMLHLTPTGMAVGSAYLDAENARRLVDELNRALDKLERK